VGIFREAVALIAVDCCCPTNADNIGVFVLRRPAVTHNLDLPTDTCALETLGQRLTQARAALNISQSEMARRLTVSPSYISELTRGKKKPGSEFLFLLRTRFGISIDWLLTGEGAMTGGSGIQIELLREIELYLALSRTAIIEENDTARRLLSLVQCGNIEYAKTDAALGAFLGQLEPSIDDKRVALVLYNGHIGCATQAQTHSGVLAEAIAYCQARKPLESFSTMLRDASS